MDDLEGWLVVIFDEHSSGLYWRDHWESSKKYYEKEPPIAIVSANDYDKNKLADLIMDKIGEDLEGANAHSINGIQDTIYQHLVRGGVNKLDAAIAIYEGFKNI